MQNKENISNWFENWFDSPYYHLLYQNRNDKEAEFFLDNLIAYLNPKSTDKMLDVACGKGRHTKYLNTLGFFSHGFDLSENSINEAKRHENSTLYFFVNDIRVPLQKNHYQFAFNLFTSFGYFENDNDNQKAIESITASLTDGGKLIIDFMNSKKVLQTLINIESKEIEGITFNINRALKNGFIIKNIEFTHHHQKYQFTERVKPLTLNDFTNYLNKAGLTIETTFGNYTLESFNESNSDRLIIIAKK